LKYRFTLKEKKGMSGISVEKTQKRTKNKQTLERGKPISRKVKEKKPLNQLSV